MEQLSRELDGFYRTPSGFCAVVPKLASGVTPEGLKWFAFRLGPYSDVIKVEWPKDSPLALFDDETSTAMIGAGYGSNPSEEMVAEYNKLVASTPPEKKFPPEGWLPHPSAPGYFYKDQEVLPEAALRAK